MGKRIVLFPFAKSSAEFTFAKKNWRDARAIKINSLRHPESGRLERLNPQSGEMEKIDISQYEFYDLSERTLVKLKEQFSTLVSGEDQLYIHGHCAPGSDVIAADSQGKVTLSVVELARLLVLGLRLPLAFAGTIKIYACHSGIALGQKKSFALQFKELMVTIKYANCQVVGYGMAVGDYYPGAHKIAFAGTEEEFKKIAAMLNKFENGLISKEELDLAVKPQISRAKDQQIPANIAPVVVEETKHATQ